jgi:hypothetical protein
MSVVGQPIKRGLVQQALNTGLLSQHGWHHLQISPHYLL